MAALGRFLPSKISLKTFKFFVFKNFRFWFIKRRILTLTYSWTTLSCEMMSSTAVFKGSIPWGIVNFLFGLSVHFRSWSRIVLFYGVIKVFYLCKMVLKLNQFGNNLCHISDVDTVLTWGWEGDLCPPMSKLVKTFICHRAYQHLSI